MSQVATTSVVSIDGKKSLLKLTGEAIAELTMEQQEDLMAMIRIQVKTMLDLNDTQNRLLFVLARSEAARTEFLNNSTTELGLTARVWNVLEQEKILVVKQLVDLTESQLLKFPGMGRNGVLDIKNALAVHGLYLATNLNETRQRVAALRTSGIGMLEQTVRVLEIPTRVQNQLMANSIVTIQNLVRVTEDHLRRVVRLGPISIDQIKAVLASHGLSLAED